MAFTDLHEIDEMFASLASAIDPREYSGFGVLESQAEHCERLKQWRRDNPQAYRAGLDRQNAAARAARAAVPRVKRTDAERRAARVASQLRYAATDKGKARRKERTAAYYAANPGKLAEKREATRAWREKKAGAK
jgi:hypothetical protein